MRKKSILAMSIALLLLQSGAAVPLSVSQYELLKDPQIKNMPAQRMLVVEAKGDPNIVGKDAFGLLFKAFFSLKGVRMAAPRARWPNLASDPKDQWVGLYGLPIPDSVSVPPAGFEGVRIEVWEYGDVAEILHLGPYTEEIPTVERLHKFVEENGYVIAGPHEEEYLKGPGMAANPSEYQTIIRYQIKKK
jgi:hypothetical protein